MSTVNRSPQEGNSGFCGNTGIAIIQLNVKTDSRAGCSSLLQTSGTNLAQLNGLINRACINCASGVNNFPFKVNGDAANLLI